MLLLQDEVATISGDRPDETAVIKFLRGTLLQEPVMPPSAPDVSRPRRRRTRRSGSTTDEGQAPAAERAQQSPWNADFKGAQPAAFWLDGVRHKATRWRAVLAGTCELLVREAGLRRFAQAVEPIRGRTRTFFSADRSQLFMPVEIVGGEFFVEGNFSANDHVRRAREALIAVRGPQGADSFTIEPASRAAPAVRPSIGETRASRPVRTDEDYTGKRPAAFRLDGVRHEATRWNEVLHGVCDRMAEEAGAGVRPARGGHPRPASPVLQRGSGPAVPAAPPGEFGLLRRGQTQRQRLCAPRP